MERPSRFDRKYTFDLPTTELRGQYLSVQNQALEAALRLTQVDIDRLAGLTDDFSYAYLKELVLSGLMLWMEREGVVPMAELMETQVETLREQMRTAPSDVFAPVDMGEVNPFIFMQNAFSRGAVFGANE